MNSPLIPPGARGAAGCAPRDKWSEGSTEMPPRGDSTPGAAAAPNRHRTAGYRCACGLLQAKWSLLARHLATENCDGGASSRCAADFAVRIELAPADALAAERKTAPADRPRFRILLVFESCRDDSRGVTMERVLSKPGDRASTFEVSTVQIGPEPTLLRVENET